MSNVKIELNSAGIREMLKSPEIEAECKKHAQNVADKAGDGFEVNTMVGKTRVNAMVYAATNAAYSKNLKENTLLKALGG